MASTYNELGIEKMATGENAGTWGTKTNTNLDIIQQAIAGYVSQAVTDSGTTALTITDGSTSTSVARNMVIKLTGALTGTSIVTVPDSVEKMYYVQNATSGSQTVTFKTASGTGVNFTGTGWKVFYSDGTNILEAEVGGVTATSTTTLSNKTLTAPKFVDGGFIADANGAESLVFGTVASALNEVKITNAATGTAGPIIASQGQTNSNLQLRPAGSGKITVGTSAANATISSKGAHDLILETNEGSSSGTITLTDASNGNITLAPEGTGEVVVGSGSSAGDITSSGTQDLILDTNAGTNSSNITITDGANGDVTVNPNGSGDFVIAGNSTQAGTIVLGADTDDTGSFSASFAPGVLTENTAYILPTAFAGTTGDVMTSTDAGVLSWATPAAGGTSWQAVVVGAGGSSTAVAGEGYFINTTSDVHTLNLPTSPTIGDEVNVIDYAGTFDTNNLTVGRGGEKIAGATADLTVATERAGFCLVYTDGTQGWLLKDK